MKKLFLFIAAALVSTGMWATVQNYALGASTFSDDKLSATVDDQTFGFSSANVGAGSASYADYGTETIKLNTGTYTITLPYGFTPTKVNIKGYSNHDSTNSSISEFDEVAQDGKTFLARGTADIKTKACVTTGYDFALDESASSFSFKIAGKQSCFLITVTGTPADCTSPTIEWNVEPQGKAVGSTDFTASVTTVPTPHAVTWTSSNTNVATVTNGTIHYVASGLTTITASLTYSGEAYCNTTVTATKTILVPIDTVAKGTNDRRWYYTTAVPSSNPDNGLKYSGTTSAGGMYGVKLDSKGYAWFEKPAVAGTLRVGAYSNDLDAAYEVNVYACDAEGKASGDALGTLSTPYAGAASSTTLDINKEVTRIRIQRKTSNQGVLYFIEFKDSGSTTALDNTADEVKAVKFFENGQLFIEKNGHVYNAMGVQVR